MKKRYGMILGMAAALVLSAGVVSGCGGKNDAEQAAASTEQTTAKAETGSEKAEAASSASETTSTGTKASSDSGKTAAKDASGGKTGGKSQAGSGKTGTKASAGGNTAAQTTAAREEQEPQVSAEDFYGCWEYEEYDIWVCIYGDGTYAWYYTDGSSSEGTYHIDGAELVADDRELTYALDGNGGLIDSEGDALFASELPELPVSDPMDGLGGDPYTGENYDYSVDFYGCWEYADTYEWLYIFADGTYDWYNNDGLVYSSTYYMDGEALCLYGEDLFYLLNGENSLIDSNDRVLYLSELPAHITLEGSDPGDYGYQGEPGVNAGDFWGCWEYETMNVWLYIYGDGTYEMYNEDGFAYSDGYYMAGDALHLEGNDLNLFLDGEGGMYDSDGDRLFQSELPAHMQ